MAVGNEEKAPPFPVFSSMLVGAGDGEGEGFGEAVEAPKMQVNSCGAKGGVSLLPLSSLGLRANNGATKIEPRSTARRGKRSITGFPRVCIWIILSDKVHSGIPKNVI